MFVSNARIQPYMMYHHVYYEYISHRKQYTRVTRAMSVCLVGVKWWFHAWSQQLFIYPQTIFKWEFSKAELFLSSDPVRHKRLSSRTIHKIWLSLSDLFHREMTVYFSGCEEWAWNLFFLFSLCIFVCSLSLSLHFFF